MALECKREHVTSQPTVTCLPRCARCRRRYRLSVSLSWPCVFVPCCIMEVIQLTNCVPALECPPCHPMSSLNSLFMLCCTVNGTFILVCSQPWCVNWVESLYPLCMWCPVCFYRVWRSLFWRLHAQFFFHNKLLVSWPCFSCMAMFFLLPLSLSHVGIRAACMLSTLCAFWLLCSCDVFCWSWNAM